MAYYLKDNTPNIIPQPTTTNTGRTYKPKHTKGKTQKKLAISPKVNMIPQTKMTSY